MVRILSPAVAEITARLREPDRFPYRILWRMLYCTNCGLEVGPGDKFCARCGARQTSAGQTDYARTGSAQGPPPHPRSGGDPLRNLSPRTASMLCYIPLAGWIACVVVLASPQFRDNRALRFNAFQGLYLFVAWLLVEMFVSPVMSMTHTGHVISRILHITIVVAWIFMLVKTSHSETYSLPIVGELAERSVAEQL